MVTLPTKQQMKELEGFGESLCLTVYIPRIDPNQSDNPNRIALKNLLKEGVEALAAAGMKPRDIDQALLPAQELFDGHEFWPVQRDSLVLFIHPKLFRYYHTPTDLTPGLLVVEAGFNLGPLRAMIDQNQHYYVLALGHKDVCLYEGDRYGLEPVRLEKFPTDLEEALGIDEYAESRESHSTASAGAGRGSEVSHGQYDASQADKVMLVEFFRKIEHRLHDFLRSHERPLVIAGVERLLPIYRSVNRYPYLLKAAITGSQSHASPKTLHQKAWEIIGRRSASTPFLG